MTAGPQQSAKRKVPLWVKVLLGLSLALNLAVVGLVAGVATRFKDAPRGAGMFNYGVPYIRALPPEDRRAIGGNLRAQAEAGQVTRRSDRRAQFQKMIVLLQSEPWDEGAAVQVLQAQSASAQALQSAAQKAWLETVSAYSVDQRKAYAEQLSMMLERRLDRRQKEKR